MRADVKKEFERLQAEVVTQDEIIKNLMSRVRALEIQQANVDDFNREVDEFMAEFEVDQLDNKVFDNV